MSKLLKNNSLILKEIFSTGGGNMATLFGTVGNGIVDNNHLLEQFLQSYSQTPVEVCQFSQKSMISSFKQTLVHQFGKSRLHFLLGWGRKKSYQRAKKLGKLLHVPVLTLEDGFLRSLDTGQASHYACSMVIDPIGIYFDSREPSYLEKLIIENNLTNEQKNRSMRLIEQICTEQLSKYNTTPKTATLTDFDFNKTQKNILLIDQVAGDQSIIGANANETTFKKMLQIACHNHPDATIWIKAHPASDLGYLNALPLSKNCQIIKKTVNAIELLKQVDEVYTVSSHMGFEALILGKTVHCFGLAWYSCWGLTDDSHIASEHYQMVWQRRGAKKQPTLHELFYACYVQYSHYANPATGKVCQIEQVIDWLVTNRKWRDNLAGNLTVYEFSQWKHGFVRDFFANCNTDLYFKPKFQLRTLLSPKHIHFPKENSFLIWGFAKKQNLIKKLSDYQPNIWCMEDGFIRSNGLGASLIAPLSVVLDRQGIYYNALQTSDLERFLQEKPTLTPDEEKRVHALIQRLLFAKVSKYNVGVNTTLNFPTEKVKILVIGQVEDDMSVKLCASDIKDNLTLLETVRNNHPDAFIIYKPHPDVQAGLRMGKIVDDKVYQFADKMLTDVNITDCLSVVDEVHTISSLTGFEALLRGLKVVCYGLPFYAGFGLTVDKANSLQINIAKQRRQRGVPLTLEQLVYTTLIDYPLYRVPDGYGLAQVEDVVDFLYNEQSSAFTKPQQKVYSSFTSLIKKQLTPQIATKLMQGRQKFQEISQYLLKNDKH